MRRSGMRNLADLAAAGPPALCVESVSWSPPTSRCAQPSTSVFPHSFFSILSGKTGCRPVLLKKSAARVNARFDRSDCDGSSS